MSKRKKPSARSDRDKMQNLLVFVSFTTYCVGSMKNITALNLRVAQAPHQVFAEHSGQTFQLHASVAGRWFALKFQDLINLTELVLKLCVHNACN